MRKILASAFIAGAVLAMASLSQAAGFRINEQGAKAMGMANAFGAQADDPSALFYNPAGIAFLKGAQVNLGSLVIAVPQTEFEGTTALSGTTTVNEKSKKDIFITPTLYATYSMENVPLTFGLGVNSIYPLAKSWDASSVFRNQIEHIAIKPINFQPTVAYRFDNLNLALAAGLDVTHAIVSLQKSAYTAGPAPTFTPFELGSLGVDGTATNVGYSLGAQWKPRDDLSFGVSYRSEITLHLKGNADFLATTQTGFIVTQMPQAFTSANSRARLTSTASTDITLPASMILASAYKPTEKLTLEFDAEWTGWSSFDKLDIHFNNPQLSAFNNKPSPKNWKDVWAYKFGAQYALNKKLDLRAGYAFDESPIPDSTLGPELPDTDRHNLSFGMGLHNDFATLDLAYMWVKFVDRTSNNQDNALLTGQNGTFKSDAHILGASVTVKF
jgi:long-chain fatty acid transport protein